MANELIPDSEQTPIEIMLAVDEEGRTTARKVYEFLELRKGDYARWCKTNIIENEFAEENVDFIAFRTNAEWGGQVSVDYKITASFAKKICMASHSERGEQAREYFLKVEKKLQEVANSHKQTEPKTYTEMFVMASNAMLEQEKRLSAVEKKQDHISEILALNPTEWRKKVNNLLNRIANSLGGFEAFRKVRNESYELLEDRANCNLKTRQVNIQKKMALEGVSKTKINNVSFLDAISYDARLTEIYLAIVKEMAIKYEVEHVQF